MAILLRATTPDFTAIKYFTVFKSATTAFCLLSFLLLCAATQVSAQHYQQTNLVSDVPGLAQFTDANLVNPWGLTSSSGSPWWVADNGTGVSTLYNGAGVKQALTVTIAKPLGDPNPATPTGIVFNGSTDFQLVPGAIPNTAARFIFVTEDGTISGWRSGSQSVLKVNNSGVAIYKGATIAQSGGSNFLYVANFFNGTVDVFNSTYTQVTPGPGAFVDPTLPEGFAPFNVQNMATSMWHLRNRTRTNTMRLRAAN
jgi:TIGR03118 family protein